jgi:hypothetical protein
MDGGVLEGWYTDPYQRHEDRWISRGVPTRLVRDLGIEGDDPVELMPFKITPVRSGHVDAAFRGASDLRRADDGYRNLDLGQRKGVNFSLVPPDEPSLAASPLWTSHSAMLLRLSVGLLVLVAVGIAWAVSHGFGFVFAPLIVLGAAGSFVLLWRRRRSPG